MMKFGRLPVAFGDFAMAFGHFKMAFDDLPATFNCFPVALGDFPMAFGHFPVAFDDFQMTFGHFSVAFGHFPAMTNGGRGRWSCQPAACSAAHMRVELLCDQPGVALQKGARGTIVHVYEDGGYEVEFIEGRTRPVVVTLEQADLEEVTGE